jgi:hypothetical protein
MVYNIQNHRDCGLCPSSGLQCTKKDSSSLNMVQSVPSVSFLKLSTENFVDK